MVFLALIIEVTCFYPPGSMAEENKNKVNIKVWAPTTFTSNQAAKKAEKDFAAQNPDITVTLETFEDPVTGKAKFITAIDAGNAPDVGLCNLWWVKDFAINDWIVPLDNLISKNTIKDYIPHFLEYASYNGKLYGLFEYTDCAVVVYRKDLFEKAGIPLPDPADPWAQDEFIKIAQQLTKGRIWGLGVNAKNEGPTTYTQFPFFWMARGELLDKSGKPSFNGDAAMKTFHLYHDLMYKYKVIPPEAISYGMADIQRGFAAGIYAMALVGNWQAHALLNTEGMEDKVGIMTYPVFKKGDNSQTIHGGWVYTILTDNPERQKAAVEYIEYMTSPKVQGAFTKEKGSLPVRVSLYKNDPYYSQPLQQVYYQALQTAKAKPGDPVYGLIQNEYTSALVSFLLDKTTAQQALNNADAAVKQKAKEQGIWEWGD